MVAWLTHDGAHDVVILLLLEDGAETVNTGIPAKEERADVGGDGVPVRENKDQRRGQLGATFPHYGFHGKSNDETNYLVRVGR